MNQSYIVKNNEQEQRFEIHEEGEVAYCEFRH